VASKVLAVSLPCCRTGGKHVFAAWTVCARGDLPARGRRPVFGAFFATQQGAGKRAC